MFVEVTLPREGLAAHMTGEAALAVDVLGARAARHARVRHCHLHVLTTGRLRAQERQAQDVRHRTSAAGTESTSGTDTQFA